ncbi:hypothetical protein [Stigmatella aurantiaca]|uniref:Conserved uncharacterized protein n=1 Tax=Stigmatella aurantiaca (strain DW4/3-1) TaxID=378806 RepID=Q08YN2_STIAD|nr:hypothetical protein [Stigmatella aurantiaca]ADO73207.1 conserved uncharacterized protein [Stigmatella aurantiaca DW4/3-1]EAU65613.1 hypothetical protein STIAU_7510 [Stigmatella aurantiaca DW4/3-1]
MRALALVLFLLGAAPAVAAMPGKSLLDHLAKGLRSTQVGDWVTYRLDGGGARVHYWRLAVVGEEKDRLGRDALWVEMEMGTHPAMRAPLSQIRMLVARGEGVAFDAGGVTRLIAAMGFDRPQEYSPEALAQVLAKRPPRPRAAPAGAGPSAPVVRSGQETRLMTPAGTVTAVPLELLYRSTVIKRTWLSREIPILQLAKIEIPRIAHALEVVEYGVDAKPRMLLPDAKTPQVRLEYVDKAFPQLPWLEEEAP